MLASHILEQVWSVLLSCSIRKWKYGHGEKNRVRDYCRFWLYYTQNMKKVIFRKVSVCVSVCVSVDFFSMAKMCIRDSRYTFYLQFGRLYLRCIILASHFINPLLFIYHSIFLSFYHSPSSVCFPWSIFVISSVSSQQYSNSYSLFVFFFSTLTFTFITNLQSDFSGYFQFQS